MSAGSLGSFSCILIVSHLKPPRKEDVSMANVGGLLEKMKQDWWKMVSVLGKPGGAAIESGISTALPPASTAPHSVIDKQHSEHPWKSHGGARD
jgi:hypothetical protein